jgi:hypothetical protein
MTAMFSFKLTDELVDISCYNYVSVNRHIYRFVECRDLLASYSGGPEYKSRSGDRLF